MKSMVIILAATASLIAAPAFAKGGNQSLNVNVALATGKGGLVGTLLKGNAASVVNANVTSGKAGVVGLLLGGKGGHGCGC